MSRWIAMHCSEEAEELQARHPNAFLLLCQIARRAKWKDCPITGLRAGEAWIGDWDRAGLHSKKAYEVAKTRLEKCELVAFQGGNKGTRATLLNTKVFSVSEAAKGEPQGTQGGNEGEANGTQGGTNHTDTQRTRTPSRSAEGDKVAEEIYQAYPRKKGRPAAIRAIKKALKGISADELLRRTRAYAVEVAGKEQQFIPHPSTWFNEERFNDEPDLLSTSTAAPLIVGGRTIRVAS